MKVAPFQIVAIFILLSTFSYSATAQQSASTSSARFQIFLNPNVRADTFLVDTNTGRVWRLTTFKDIEDNPTVWISMDRIDDDKQLMNFVRSHKLKQVPDKSQTSQ